MILREGSECRPLLPIPPGEDLVYVPMEIDDALTAALNPARSRLPDGLNCSDAQLLAALAVAQARSTRHDHAPPAPALSVRVLQNVTTLTPRPEQLALASLVDQTLQYGRIAILEAATGSGKGLVIAAAAIAASRRGQRVAVAAPTHQINRQTYQHLIRDLGETSVALVYGRTSFASRDALAATLAEDEQVEAADRAKGTTWLNGQDLLFARGQRSQLYLLDSLLHECPSLPREELTLRAYDRCAAAECYDHQFIAAQKANIVLLTHAMLATLNRRELTSVSRLLGQGKGGRSDWREVNAELAEAAESSIGDVAVLLIDEAHTFEQNVTGALSDLVSMRSLERKCRHLASRAPAGADAAKSVSDSVSSLASLDEAICSLPNAGQAQDAVVRELSQLQQRLQGVLRPFGAGDSTTSRRKPAALDPADRAVLDDVRRTMQIINFALSHPGGQLVQLRHSPDRRYPQLTVGPRSVRRQMDFLWQRLEAAALFSATLYTETVSGVPSCAAVASRLSIDPVRLLTHLPVLPEWLTKPVTLNLPGIDCQAWLPPPRDALEGPRTAYYEAVGAAVSRFCDPARGGSLVLCTSHEAIRRLGAAWSGDPDRLLLQSREVPFATTLRRFVQLSLDGQRPVWFATGQAWTGLDVYSALPADVPMPAPEDDVLLTTLVIPRLPFDLNTTSTELARRQHQGAQEWLSIVHECQLLLRQGIGRLIRRQQLTDRQLAILDPRCSLPTMRGMSAIRSLWSRYPQQRVLASSDQTLSLILDPPNSAPAAATSWSIEFD